MSPCRALVIFKMGLIDIHVMITWREIRLRASPTRLMRLFIKHHQYGETCDVVTSILSKQAAQKSSQNTQVYPKRAVSIGFHMISLICYGLWLMAFHPSPLPPQKLWSLKSKHWPESVQLWRQLWRNTSSLSELARKAWLPVELWQSEKA